MKNKIKRLLGGIFRCGHRITAEEGNPGGIYNGHSRPLIAVPWHHESHESSVGW